MSWVCFQTASCRSAPVPSRMMRSMCAISRRVPSVLILKTTPVNSKGRVLPQKFEKLGNDCLDQRRDCKRVIHPGLGIADAHLQRIEERVQPNVPPDFLRVINATGLDQQLAVVFVLGKALERVGNSGARKTLKHFQAITFQARVLADPERRVGRERVNVREKIARLIHHVNGALPIRNADMHMQSEDEIGARELLHVLDDLLISLALSNELIAPVRKRMRARRSNL